MFIAIRLFTVYDTDKNRRWKGPRKIFVASMAQELGNSNFQIGVYNTTSDLFLKVFMRVFFSGVQSCEVNNSLWIQVLPKRYFKPQNLTQRFARKVRPHLLSYIYINTHQIGSMGLVY